MFGIVLLTLVLISLASIYSDLMMRIRLTKRLPPENGLSWWMRSSDEVGRTYQELLPGSSLPSIHPVCVLAISGHSRCCCGTHCPAEINLTEQRPGRI